MKPNKILEINYYKIDDRYYTISHSKESLLDIDYIWIDVNFANIYDNIANGNHWHEKYIPDFIKENEDNIIVELFSYLNNVLSYFDLDNAKCIMFTYDNMIYNRITKNRTDSDEADIVFATHEFANINNNIFLMSVVEAFSNKLNWHYTGAKDMLSYYFAQVSSNISINKRGAIFLYSAQYDFSSVSSGEVILLDEISKKIVEFEEIKSIAIVSTNSRVPEVSRILNTHLLEHVDNITMVFSSKEIFDQHIIYVKKILFDNYRDRIDNMTSKEENDSISWRIPITSEQKIII
jgi:hypothetical protein